MGGFFGAVSTRDVSLDIFYEGGGQFSGVDLARTHGHKLVAMIGEVPLHQFLRVVDDTYGGKGYENAYELGPREIVRLTAEGCEVLSPAGEEMKICSFLWSYYGYPNSNYEGVNVELMRYRNGAVMARDESRPTRSRAAMISPRSVRIRRVREPATAS